MLFGHRLENYLAWYVHGRRTHRAPARKRNGPARNERYKNWIRSQPCLCCGFPGRCEAAHTGQDGGLSQKPSDYSCVPLCSDCHTLGEGAYHRIGKREFERRYHVSFAKEVARLNREWKVLNG